MLGKALRERQVNAEVKEKRSYRHGRDWKLQRNCEMVFTNIKNDVKDL